MTMLTHYPWPGNIREMRSVLERAAQIAERSPLTAKDMELQWPGGTPVKPDAPALDTNLTMREFELRYIGLVLTEERGSIDRAAERLGISRSSLYSKVKKKEVERMMS
jgi:DNA-binding NtrC family response regulator